MTQPIFIILLFASFALSCSQTGTADLSSTSTDPSSDNQQQDSSGTLNPDQASDGSNSSDQIPSSTKSAHVVPYNPCKNNEDCVKKPVIPPQELWCATGYRACPEQN